MNLQRVFLCGSLLCGVFLNLFLVPTSHGQARPRVVEAVDDARRVTLSGNVHPLARAEFDRGAVANSLPMNRILLLLKRSDEQEAALQDLLAKQQDKSEASFHQWLTPEQFGAQFGVADADIQAVTDWLTRQGFSIGKIYSSKTVIEFSGTAAQVQQAFGTAIHNYEVNGKTYSANASDPQIPAALAPVIAGVVSLHNFPRQFYARRFGTLRREAGKNIVEPLTTFPGGPYGTFYGLGPGDFAKIYGVPATCGSPATACNGAGQTIAIVGETNLTVSDVQQFRSIFGLPATFDQNSIILNGEDPGITSKEEEGEALLDTQWSGGAAPGATIKYVLSASTPASQGIDLSALYIVEHNLAAVMSESYGACEPLLGSAENSFYNNLWQQASAQGITAAVSTGDSGSAGCDDPNTEGLATHGPAVSGLASTPYNVAVGGTDFDEYARWSTFWSATNDATTGTSALGYIPEIPWNQSCAQLGASGCNINTTPLQLQNIVAGGGGPSQRYNRPSWQMGVNGMPTGTKREQPDISLLASPGFNGTGFLYCQSDLSSPCSASPGFSGFLSFGIVGGTSASAPTFGGIMALVNQSQATAQNPAPRQGNANYILYALANKSGASCSSGPPPVATGCIFNDITKGSSALPTGGTGIGTNSVPCTGGVSGCSATLSSQIGVLDSPSSPGMMAWNVNPGYDRATGLGSMNVGNLITAWGTASSVQTTTTLGISLPQGGLTHGSTPGATVNISVTPKAGTATGTVSLIALEPAQPSGTTPFSVGSFTLGANGSVTGMTQNLPGGPNYQVYAHYSGDGVNAPSDSQPQTVTVAAESSKTFIVVPTFDPTTGNLTNGNATSVTYGSPYIVRMYVTNSAGAVNPSGTPTGACTQSSTVACPSGTVTLTANGSPVDGGTFNLNSIGYTRDISPTLPGGTYPLAAAYSGDTSYQVSQASEAFTVNPAATTLAAPYSGSNPVIIGSQGYLSTTLSTQALSGVAPTGTVTFYDGSTALTAPVTISTTTPNGTVTGALYASTFPTFTATTGQHSITAKYIGDGNYAAATSSSTTVDVVYLTLLSLNASATTINFGQSVTLTAVVTSQGKSPAITGQVQFSGPYGATFSNVTTTPGTDNNGNQMLTVTATTVPQQSGVFSAYYPGDTNYLTTSSNVLVNVSIPDFTLGPQSGLSVVPTAGQSSSGQITVSPVTSTQPPSPVILQVSQTSFAGYTISLNPTQINLNGAAATAMLTLTPNGSTPAVAFRTQVRKASIFPLPRASGWRLGLAAGLAFVLFASFPARRKKLRTAFGLSLVCLLCFVLGCGGGGGAAGTGGGGSGGGSGGGGGGGGGTSPGPSSVVLTTSNSKVALGAPFTITAAVTGNNPTGTVTFYDYGTAITGPFTLVGGQAQIGVGSLNAIGIHQITATYSGDAHNLTSTSAAVSQVLTGTVPITIQGSTGSDFHTIQATVGVQ